MGNGDIRLVKSINSLDFPKAVILGNHDRGTDLDGHQLIAQNNLLGKNNCAWSCKEFPQFPIAIVGGRPCSAGGGDYLSTQMQSVYGHVAIETSVNRIVDSLSYEDYSESKKSNKIDIVMK